MAIDRMVGMCDVSGGGGNSMVEAQICRSIEGYWGEGSLG